MKIMPKILFVCGFLLVIALVLTGCSKVVYERIYEHGKSFSPKAKLPEATAGYPSMTELNLNRRGYARFGVITVEGSSEEALREAAKRGADVVHMQNRLDIRGSRRVGFRGVAVIEVTLYSYDPPRAYENGFSQALSKGMSEPANVKVFLDLAPNLAKDPNNFYFTLVSKLRPRTDITGYPGPYRGDLDEQPESILEAVKLLIAAGANLNATPRGVPSPDTSKERLLPGVPGYPTLLQLVEDSLSQPTGSKNVPHERARRVLAELRGVLRGGPPKKHGG